MSLARQMKRSSLDNWLQQANEIVEKAKKAELYEDVIRKGYVQYEKVGLPELFQDLTFVEAGTSLVARAVFVLWNFKQQPLTLNEIFSKFKELEETYRRMGLWGYKPLSKRTVDRLVNFCADPRLSESNKPPRIIRIKPGIYIPNPFYFDDETKIKLQRLAKGED
ncbi:MAG: hypothetical protein QXE57_05035 [Nitrososphaerales archaeon]